MDCLIQAEGTSIILPGYRNGNFNFATSDQKEIAHIKDGDQDYYRIKDLKKGIEFTASVKADGNFQFDEKSKNKLSLSYRGNLLEEKNNAQLIGTVDGKGTILDQMIEESDREEYRREIGESKKVSTIENSNYSEFMYQFINIGEAGTDKAKKLYNDARRDSDIAVNPSFWNTVRTRIKRNYQQSQFPIADLPELASFLKTLTEGTASNSSANAKKKTIKSWILNQAQKLIAILDICRITKGKLPQTPIDILDPKNFRLNVNDPERPFSVEFKEEESGERKYKLNYQNSRNKHQKGYIEIDIKEPQETLGSQEIDYKQSSNRAGSRSVEFQGKLNGRTTGDITLRQANGRKIGETIAA